MISYAPFFETLKRKGVSTYKLINDYNISSSLLNRMKHGKPITTTTIHDFCVILDCHVEDIVVYVKDEESQTQH